MKDTRVKICRKCGQPIYIIPQRMYRSIPVDAEAVEVVADTLGDEYIRWDGTMMRARKIGRDEIVQGAEYAYRQHSKTCGISDDL